MRGADLTAEAQRRGGKRGEDLKSRPESAERAETAEKNMMSSARGLVVA
jgi:hypothetical protein